RAPGSRFWTEGGRRRNSRRRRHFRARIEAFQGVAASFGNRGKFPGTQLRDEFSRLQEVESLESPSVAYLTLRSHATTGKSQAPGSGEGALKSALSRPW